MQLVVLVRFGWTSWVLLGMIFKFESLNRDWYKVKPCRDQNEYLKFISGLDLLYNQNRRKTEVYAYSGCTIM